MNEFNVEYMNDSKEVFVSYTKSDGTSMKLFGTYKANDSEQYKDYIVNVLKERIKGSKWIQM
jgi:hypothetical protein